MQERGPVERDLGTDGGGHDFHPTKTELVWG